MAAAIHTLDTLLQPPNPQRSVEATAMLASLRANPRPGVSTSEVTKEKARARELFERVIKALELPEDLQRRPSSSSNGISVQSRPNKSARNIAEDIDMHTEIAKLWQGENPEIMSLAVKEALRINEASSSGTVDPRLMNNLGVLRHIDADFIEARTMYELALTRTATSGFQDDELGEAVATTILYNLARVYEDQGEIDIAREAYEKLLSRHPEYVDGNILPVPCRVNI
jgi:RNA polymerase-associated protein CTR9